MGLDAVELVLAWEHAFDISVSEAEAAHLLTTRQVTEFFYQRVRDVNTPEDTGCLSMRAYYRLRRALQKQEIHYSRIRADSKLSDLLPRKDRRTLLSQILVEAGFDPLRRMPFGLQFTFGRVKDYVLDGIISHHGSLRVQGMGWSREQVREVIRTITKAQMAVNKLSDDARFVQDLGIGFG